MTATAAGQHPAAGGRLHFRAPAGAVEVWLLRLTGLPDACRRQLLADMPELMPDAPPERRLAHIVIRHWLAELLDTPATGITLATRPQGKPWLPGRALAINYSHSRHWLALAWSREPGEIGVDVEDLGRGQAFEALARRYFHPDELAAWQATGADQRERCWLRTWTRKEAVLKAHGLGLRLRLDTLDTRTDTVRHAALGSWRAHSHDLDDAMLSIAWPD